MNSTSEWPVSTTKYRLSLPFALQSISPALSALHATRAATLHPEVSSILHSSHCTKCGAYHFSGNGPSHLFGQQERKKRKRGVSSGPKALQRICPTCGFTDQRINVVNHHDVEPTLSPHSTILQSSISAQLPSASLTTSIRTSTSKKKPRQQSEPSGNLHPIVGTSSEIPPRASPQPFPKQLPRLKTSHTKKASTLQDMLARDRRRDDAQKAHKRTKDNHGGLVAFLKDL
ncbi:hypothetical protein BS17DRAFT_784320 [Gyrodon lividus]|nr:hypothetical protein BS17DRAFT_784320 [Gyrodon lividus]